MAGDPIQQQPQLFHAEKLSSVLKGQSLLNQENRCHPRPASFSGNVIRPYMQAVATSTRMNRRHFALIFDLNMVI
jgi:hypothetical protein